MSIRLKLTLLLSLLFIAAIANSLFTFQLENYGDEKLKWVNHTHQVLIQTEVVLNNLKDAETGQRGFLLTDDASYLEPYHRGILAAQDNFIQLQNLTADNPKQQKMLNLISDEITLKFAELKQTIELSQNGQKTKAMEVVIQNTGKQHMDNIRTHFNTFINTELVLLEIRKGDFRENRAQITTLIAVEVVFFIGLAILTISFIRRNLFSPLKQLLDSARKVEAGEKLKVLDVVEQDEMGHLLSSFYNMSERVYERVEKLDHKARHDELTGLKNRATIGEDLIESLHSAQQNSDKLSLLFLDLNLFKQINDTLGHDVGDLILKETAKRLNETVRASDTVYRLGGDEFVVILRNIKHQDDVYHISDKILSAFKQPASINGKPMEISISIGAATAPDDTEDDHELIKFADIAMYTAKQDPETNFRMFERKMLKRKEDS